MLVLSRKVDQEILVGDGIRIVVTRISGNRVSIGIEAPMHTSIVRGEMLRGEMSGDECVEKHVASAAEFELQAG